MTSNKQYNWNEISTVLKNVSHIVNNKAELNDYLKNFFLEIGYHKLFEQLILSDNMDHYWKLDFNIINLIFGNVTLLIQEIRRSEMDPEIQNELIDFFELCEIVTEQNASYSKIGITYKFQHVTPRNFQGKPLKLSSKINSAQLFCELIEFRNIKFSNIENLSPLYQTMFFENGNKKYIFITLKNNEEKEIRNAISVLSKMNNMIFIDTKTSLTKDAVIGTYRRTNNALIKIRSIQPPLDLKEELLFDVL
jgi:hypothetical protein